MVSQLLTKIYIQVGHGKYKKNNKNTGSIHSLFYSNILLTVLKSGTVYCQTCSLLVETNYQWSNYECASPISSSHTRQWEPWVISVFV